jgi:TonB family protein
MEKFGMFISLAEMEASALGTLHRGFKAEGPGRKEHAHFYRVPHPLQPSETYPHHISVLDVLHQESASGAFLFGHRSISGFPLSLVFKRCLQESFPFPADHALLVLERVLAAFEEYPWGFAHPGLVWMTFEGEVKCSPLPVARAFHDWKPAGLSPYLSPQVLGGKEWGQTDRVYAAGALFFELLTGISLPASRGSEDGINAVLTTPSAMEGPIPKNLQMILLKALAAKPEERYPTVGTMRAEIGELIYSGAYSPTTFNLAFFMHTLFRNEVEREEKQLKQEDALDLSPLFKTAGPPVRKPGAEAAPDAASPSGGKTKRSPLVYAALGAVALALLTGAYFLFSGKTEESPPLPLRASQPLAVQKQKALEKELQESQQALEDLRRTAAKQKEEMDKLLAARQEGQKTPEIQKAIEQKQKEARDLEDRLKQAEQVKKNLQEQKTLTEQPSPPAAKPDQPPPAGSDTSPGVPAPTAPEVTPAAKQAPAESAPKPSEEKPAAVREGDLVPLAEVDSAPVPTKKVTPVYPAMAKMRKVAGRVTVKVLLSETGKPLEITVVSVNPSSNYGFDKAAVDAIRQWEFQPARKGSVRVRTWFIIPIVFE